MATINDYVQWYSDIPFEKYPIQNEDAMILCQLSYVVMDTVAQTLHSLYEISHLLPEPEISILGGDPSVISLLHLCGSSKRYGDLQISDYSSVFNQDTQFSAVTYRYKDSAFIAFRGTDGSVAGWKEDFRISYTKIQSQRLALDYMNHVQSLYPAIRHWYVGGHSKGGNLALFACLQNHTFDHAWLLDSPGMCPDVFDISSITKIEDRLTLIQPQYSIVGRIFELDIPNTIIVSSSAQGILQHALYSWQIEHGKLVTMHGHDSRSSWVIEVLNEWLADKTMEQREQFTNDLFDSFSKDPTDSFDDLMKKGPSFLEETLLNFSTSSDAAKYAALDLPATAIFGKGKVRQWIDNVLEDMQEGKNTLLKSILLIIAGLLFAYASEHIMAVCIVTAMTILTLFEAAVSIQHLKANNWDFTKEETRVTITIIFSVTTFVLCFKENALFVLGSFIFGAGFLAVAYHQASLYSKQKKRTFLRFIYILETITFTILGISYLIIPEWSSSVFTMTAGWFLAIDGILRLLNLHFAHG